MMRVLPRYCPRCGAPIITDSRTCSTCGLAVEAMQTRDQPKPPEQTIQFNQDQSPEIDQQATQNDLYIQQNNEQASVQAPPIDQQNYSPKVTRSFQERDEQDYAFSPPAPRLRSMGRRRVILLLAALLLVLGAIAYVIAGFLGVALPGFATIQPPVTTTAINSSVPYAGVDVTILNVQQSQRFINDPHTSANGMVRLNLSEHNQTNVKVSWSYENIARLILPDKSIVIPTYANAKVALAPGASQTSLLDFAVPSNDRVSQLTLRLGAANESQMFIPLTVNANLSNYQPKTINLNGQMQYFGLNWALTSATSSLSIDGQQAAKGMRYLTVTLKVDNTLSQVAITGSAFDFVRLKVGSITALPKHATLPVAFDGGVAGVTGTVSFLVPQNARSYTLILEPQNEDSGDKASTDFQFT